MFGKNSMPYKAWADHAQILSAMPYNCEVINVGSTASYRAFDYRLWEKKGFNLGYTPQTIYYDFEMLKKYSDHIAKGAKILLGVENFKFFVDAYDANLHMDRKYYLWLNNEQIGTYKKSEDWCMKHAPILLYPSTMKSGLKRGLKRLLGKENRADILQAESEQLSEQSDINWSYKWLDGWNRQFGWEQRQVLRSEQKITIELNKKRLSNMIDYCFSHEWEPYLLAPPLSPNLTKLLTDSILQCGYWDPLYSLGTERKIKVLDYYRDKRFADFKLYEDALALNDKGRALFNAIVQVDIL